MQTINIAEALDRLDGDQEIFNELISAFLEDSQTDVSHLGQAVSEGDLAKTAYHAHKIKGAALTLGAERLSYRAELLEKASRNADNTDYTALFKDTEEEYQAAIQRLSELKSAE